MSRPRNKPYTDRERREALGQIALESGNVAEASRKLGIDPSTLRKWKDQEPDRYESIRKDMEARIDSELSERLIGLMSARIAAAEATLPHYLEALEAGHTSKARELAQADGALLKSLGLSNQQSRIIREKPNMISEQRTSFTEVQEALSELRRLGSVDTTAEDLTNDETPELVEGSDTT